MLGVCAAYGSPPHSSCELLRINLVFRIVLQQFLHRCAAYVVWAPNMEFIADSNVKLWMHWSVLHRVPAVFSC